MRYTLISRATSLLDATLLIGAALMPTAASPQSTPPQWTPMVYTSLNGDTITVDSARVGVPERHGASGGKQISLAVMRFRSTAARPGAPVVFLAGGPGNAGTNSARGEVFSTIMALRSFADVIVYDQRGTGRTLPSLVVRAPMGVIPLDASITSERARDAMLSSAKAAAAEIRSRDIDLSAYNTVESADDLDDLRRALAVDKIIVWGHSYGSHLAFAYVKRHEAHVERLVVSGVNGPDQRRRFPLDGDVLLSRIDSIIRRAPELSAAFPDFLGATRRLLDRLGQQPALVRVDSSDVSVGKAEIQLLIALQSGELAFVQSLPAMVAEMEAGDFSKVARVVRDGLKRRPLGTAMTYAMDMSSGASAERMARIREEAPRAILGGAINFPFDDPAYAEAWGIRPLPDDFRRPVVSKVPALFISGTLDGRTSITDAEEVRRGFANSGHIVVDGSAHTPYHLSEALRTEVVRFVTGDGPVSKHLVVEVRIRPPVGAR